MELILLIGLKFPEEVDLGLLVLLENKVFKETQVFKVFRENKV
jgi:hypothetical protein